MSGVVAPLTVGLGSVIGGIGARRAAGVVGVPIRAAPSSPSGRLEGWSAACVNDRFVMLSIALGEHRLEADLRDVPDRRNEGVTRVTLLCKRFGWLV